MDEEAGETQAEKDEAEGAEEADRDGKEKGEDPKPMDPLPSL